MNKNFKSQITLSRSSGSLKSYQVFPILFILLITGFSSPGKAVEKAYEPFKVICSSCKNIELQSYLRKNKPILDRFYNYWKPKLNKATQVKAIVAFDRYEIPLIDLYKISGEISNPIPLINEILSLLDAKKLELAKEKMAYLTNNSLSLSKGGKFDGSVYFNPSINDDVKEIMIRQSLINELNLLQSNANIGQLWDDWIKRGFYYSSFVDSVILTPVSFLMMEDLTSLFHEVSHHYISKEMNLKDEDKFYFFTFNEMWADYLAASFFSSPNSKQELIGEKYVASYEKAYGQRPFEPRAMKNDSKFSDIAAYNVTTKSQGYTNGNLLRDILWTARSSARCGKGLTDRLVGKSISLFASNITYFKSLGLSNSVDVERIMITAYVKLLSEMAIKENRKSCSDLIHELVSKKGGEL